MYHACNLFPNISEYTGIFWEKKMKISKAEVGTIEYYYTEVKTGSEETDTKSFTMCESRSVVSNSLQPHGLYTVHEILQARTGVGSCSCLQEIFPTQGLNPGLLHCRQILYQLSHQGSPRILEWVAYPFSSRSSRPRDRTGVSCIAGGFFTRWATRWATRGALSPSDLKLFS